MINIPVLRLNLAAENWLGRNLSIITQQTTESSMLLSFYQIQFFSLCTMVEERNKNVGMEKQKQWIYSCRFWFRKKIICNNSYFSKAIGSSTEGFKNSFAYRLANANDQTSFFHEAPVLKPKNTKKMLIYVNMLLVLWHSVNKKQSSTHKVY